MGVEGWGGNGHLLEAYTFLTFTYRDFTFIVLVVSIIVDTCIAGPVRVVVGPALNTVM